MMILITIILIINLLMTFAVLCVSATTFNVVDDLIKIWKEILDALERTNGNN